MKDDFIGTKFNDGKLTVVGAGKKNGYYLVKCSECANDRELFNDAIFEVSKYSLIKGSLPCGCSKSPQWSPSQYKIRLERVIKDKYDLISNEEITHSKQSIRLMCKSDSHVWDTNVNKTLSNSGCPKCSGRLVKTEIEARELILKKCGDNSVKFHGFHDNWKNSKSKLKLECQHGHRWTPSYDNFVNKIGSCPTCRYIDISEKLSNKDAYELISNRCSELDVKFHGFVGNDYKNCRTKVELECQHGHRWSPEYSSFVNAGCGCPACAKHGYNTGKAGVFYVVHWKKAGHEFLKYGITNKGESRITRQTNKTDYKPTIIYFPEFSDGNVAAELERECHARRNELYGKDYVVSKDEFPDGYTETMNVDQWEWINDLVFESSMTRLKPLS